MRRRLAAVLLLLLATTPASAEDVLVLTSGRRVRGVLIEETPERLRLRVEGGSIWYDRKLVREVERGETAAPAATAEAPRLAAASREESALLYADGKRAGTRTFHVVVKPDEYEFDERVVFLGPDGKPAMEMRTLERSGRDFTPRFFQIQESSSGGDRHRLVRGEVAGDVLTVTVVRGGETTTRTTDAAVAGRFPFAAREEFLRGGWRARKQAVRVFDTRDQRWRDVTYEDGGTKVVERRAGGPGVQTVRTRVVLRRRGERLEREWIGPDLVAEMVELNGDALRALRADRDVVAAVRGGDSDRVTGPDSAARALYADAVEGFRIEKPDPSWTFESPAVRGAGALLSVRNAPLMASVDVLRDDTAGEDVTLDRAGEALERVMRAHAPDLRVVDKGLVETPTGRHFWLEANATRKGERTVTIARIHLREGRVYRLLAACVEDGAGLCRPDLDKILDSFAFIER